MANRFTHRVTKLLRKNQNSARYGGRQTIKPSSIFDAKHALYEVEELQGERTLEESRDQFAASAPRVWF